MHFQALSCNGRLPKSLQIRYLASTDGAHNAGVEGSRAIVDLKRFALRLGLFAREQRRSDEGLHDETPRMGSGKPGRDGPRL